ncbi:hypothetical protein Pcinc_029696 [Petrolisthes cinctipes]|uniref:G-protein coupled receptors family 1 profile domain-containing protein n=1 Tax=Petrolisthes cinctipes TaxID=88211 RepID=A0AAE1F0S3_PETCI|nr:hypothetical protein Pcinc_029696 [Petrolisthes cinctipes]
MPTNQIYNNNPPTYNTNPPTYNTKTPTYNTNLPTYNTNPPTYQPCQRTHLLYSSSPLPYQPTHLQYQPTHLPTMPTNPSTIPYNSPPTMYHPCRSLVDTGLVMLPQSVFISQTALLNLYLSHNQLKLKDQSFPRLSNLASLYLDYNNLTVITTNLLANLTNLHTLRLEHNKISVVCVGAFLPLANLKYLSLSGNRLTSLAGLLRGLHSLHLLKLEELELHNIQEQHFNFLPNLTVVYFDTFRYCSYVPAVPQCLPNSDGVSSAEDLVGWWVLRVAVWVVAVLTLTGNSLVIFCRAISRKDNEILKLFIKNLAASDFLMGVYLVVVGVEDARTRGTFHSHSLRWATSYTCTFAGVLALVSSETSVFILTFMSLERYLYITEGLHDRTVSPSGARLCLLVIWITSLSLALFPIPWVESFYGSNPMCFPLHITEPYLAGWQYSAFIFLGLNPVSMMVILGSYTGLFFNIRGTRLSTPLSSDEMNFALRFFFIVVTNCLCWLPIICVKVAALVQVDIHQGLYAWLVVLVLPVNSAVDPGLYTFSTSQFQSQLTTTLALLNTHRPRHNSDTEALRHSSTRVWTLFSGSHPPHLASISPPPITTPPPHLVSLSPPPLSTPPSPRHLSSFSQLQLSYPNPLPQEMLVCLSSRNLTKEATTSWTNSKKDVENTVEQVTSAATTRVEGNNRLKRSSSARSTEVDRCSHYPDTRPLTSGLRRAPIRRAASASPSHAHH